MSDSTQKMLSSGKESSKTVQTPFKWLLPVMTVAVIVFHWLSDSVKTNNLLYDVNKLGHLSEFETPYIYTYLHLFAFLPVFSLSFDKKVAYFKSWRYLFPALFIVAVIFWFWDIWKTAAGVWGFNPKYYSVKLINLPIEEWMFFFTFPWASVFIYECLNAYFPKNRFFKRWEHPLSITLIVLFFVIGLMYWGHAYTATTSIVAGSVLLWHFLFGVQPFRAQFYRSFLVGLIPFVLVNGVLTGSLTQQPVVIYNPEEYVGIRLVTIPVDDFIYNFALLFGVTMLFEYFRNKWSHKTGV